MVVAVTVPAKRLKEDLEENKGWNSAVIIDPFQLKFSLTSFFSLKLFFIPFITTNVFSGEVGVPLHFLFIFFLLPCFIICQPQGQYEPIEEPRATCKDYGNWAKSVMKLDISPKVKYVLCALYHVTANLKIEGCVLSHHLTVVSN